MAKHDGDLSDRPPASTLQHPPTTSPGARASAVQRAFRSHKESFVLALCPKLAFFFRVFSQFSEILGKISVAHESADTRVKGRSSDTGVGWHRGPHPQDPRNM